MKGAAKMADGPLSRLNKAWREIAHGTARSLGLKALAAASGDRQSLEALMRDCLEARGGEVSARMRAAELGQTYLELEEEGKAVFLDLLATSFATDPESVAAAAEAYRTAEGDAARAGAERNLRAALEAPRLKLLTQFNALPEGVKFLVGLRADILGLNDPRPEMQALDRDLRGLLESWFDFGFLDLEEITWGSPAELLEKLIDFEAVHEIRSWDDLRNRLDSDRRCYALFHPRMPAEPLAFVEVALVKGVSGSIQDLLDESAPEGDPKKADTAIFYSISNTQKGLQGVSFGEFLIKRAVMSLAGEFANLKTFATLSPVPGFLRWLKSLDEEGLAPSFTREEQGGTKALGGADDLAPALGELLDRPDWCDDPVVAEALKEPLRHLAARYFRATREDGFPIDPVARFHLKNGARLDRLNILGDRSEKGLKQAAGLMVNYLYDRGEMEKNHEAYMREGKLAIHSDIKALAKADRSNASALRKLGFG